MEVKILEKIEFVLEGAHFRRIFQLKREGVTILKFK